MKIRVLGGCGGWPAAGQACSGYLVEHRGFRLVIDLGYATLPRLLESTAAEQIDAVVITHRHPDHCADLNALLRARAFGDEPASLMPIYALPGAADAVLALDDPRMLADAYALHEFRAGDRFDLGPFQVETRSLPHFVPNAGLRLTADGAVLAYTGDSGPTPDVVNLARGADLLIAEATYVEQVPNDSAKCLSSARQVARQAAESRAAGLVLTHLWPGTDPVAALKVANEEFNGPIWVASSGLALSPARKS